MMVISIPFYNPYYILHIYKMISNFHKLSLSVRETFTYDPLI